MEVLGCVGEAASLDYHQAASRAWRCGEIGPECLVLCGPEGYQGHLWIEQGHGQGMLTPSCSSTGVSLTVLPQSDFYPVQNAVAKGRRLQSLFSTVDEDYHARYRRCVNNAFAMSSLVNYEPLVSSTVGVFLDKTQEMYANTGKSCNFSQWLQYFAFDVIGDLTWSKRLGFVEENRDVDGIIAFLQRFLSYAGPVSQNDQH